MWDSTAPYGTSRWENAPGDAPLVTSRGHRGAFPVRGRDHDPHVRGERRGPNRRAPAGRAVRLRRVQCGADAGLLRLDADLGRCRRSLGRREPARGFRERRGMAPRRHAGAQAERVRRLRRGRRVTGQPATGPRHEQLAIMGGSNGGLLVGAALTQHPERYAAVVCSAPLLDMVRYEHFGLGRTWNDEYGRAADPEELGWLLGYSPYHRVVAGTAYPAVLFTTFDSDTRVDPLHARKTCAALQHATTGAGPILLRRELDVGHGQRSISRTLDLAADQLAFLAAHTGLSAGGPTQR
ncbi:MAG: prolyl oligopeptidase family serine peptidase [Hymenobacter sp.]